MLSLGSHPDLAGVPTIHVAPGAPARQALWDLVASRQDPDPLAPVTVAVPSPYAGLSLRRELGRQRGLVNVRFLALSGIAELLGAPHLASTGRTPLTPARRTEAVRAVLQADPGPFASVASHRGTEEGLAATITDLRRAPDGALDALAQHGSRGGALLHLYRAYRELTADSYDDQDLALAASDAAPMAPPALAELGHVIVHLPRRLSDAEATLVRGLAAAGRATVILTASGVPTAPTAPPVADRVVSTPDPEDEVRAALRRLLARANAGASLSRMAILYPVREPYARLVPQILAGADVPWNGPSPTRLADSVTGRVVGQLVSLVDEDFARDAVANWLVSGPILDADERPVPGARWDLVSRTAGVVAGADQWADRLNHHRDQLRAAWVTARDGDDQPEWRLGRLEADLEHTARLEAFMTELVAQAQPPASPSWAEFSGWCQTLLSRYLGGEGRRAGWPERELDAARRVDAALADLASLDDLGAGVDLPRFRVALDGALDAPAAHVGRFGTGVFVGPLAAAVGAAFDTVAIVGATEGSLPARGKEDPFLPDADRAALGLATTATRRADDRNDYLAALAAAEHTLLCFPRADPRAQQARLPARWLLETATTHAGHPLTAEALRALGGQDWLDVVESFEQGVTTDAEPASLAERDLRSLAAWRATGRTVLDHPLATGALGRGFALAHDRASKRFTSYDGNTGSSPALDRACGHPLGATALQDWATCPRRYFLGRVLHVREVARPEAIENLRPVDEGTLLHAIFEEFVRERPPSSPNEAWTGRDRARMEAIVARHCAAAEAGGLTGRPLLWRLARRRIERTAAGFLAVDVALRRAHDAAPRPETLEVSFGDGKPEVSVTRPAGQTVHFRGRVDRIDVSPDGQRAVVYDYKTGRVDSYEDLEDDPVVGGELLQLPIYALAARAITGASDIEAFYWFTRAETAHDAPLGYRFDREVEGRFETVVDTIVTGIGAGCFPADPGPRDFDYRVQRETFEHCFGCPYDRLCPLDRATTFARKEDDPALEPYWALHPDDRDEQ